MYALIYSTLYFYVLLYILCVHFKKEFVFQSINKTALSFSLTLVDFYEKSWLTILRCLWALGTLTLMYRMDQSNDPEISFCAFVAIDDQIVWFIIHLRIHPNIYIRICACATASFDHIRVFAIFVMCNYSHDMPQKHYLIFAIKVKIRMENFHHYWLWAT